MSLSLLAAEFLERKETVLRQSTIKDYRGVLEGDYFAPWKALPVNQIPRRSVLDRYQAICQQHGVGMANKAMRVLSAALNYAKATHTGLDGWENPVRVLSESRMRIQSRPRTSHIPLAKLSDWLAALENYRTAELPQPDKDRREDVYLLLNLLLMTGLRSNEAQSLRWADISLENRTLDVTAERAKNGRAARLPLNSWLVEGLKQRQVSAGTIRIPERIDRWISLQPQKTYGMDQQELRNSDYTPRSTTHVRNLSGRAGGAIRYYQATTEPCIRGRRHYQVHSKERCNGTPALLGNVVQTNQ